jgi:hypothetical protein
MRSNKTYREHSLASLLITGMLVLLALIVVVSRTDAAQGPPGEYEVKTAFIFNFIKFVEWPAASLGPGNTINLCILGSLPGGAALNGLDGQGVAGKRLAVRHAVSAEDLHGCQAVFIAGSEERGLHRILGALAGANVLTIGDTDGFARDGVIINFYLERKKVRFEINIEAAQRAGLKLSSQLIRLAGAVYGKPAGE